MENSEKSITSSMVDVELQEKQNNVPETIEIEDIEHKPESKNEWAVKSLVDKAAEVRKSVLIAADIAKEKLHSSFSLATDMANDGFHKSINIAANKFGMLVGKVIV